MADAPQITPVLSPDGLETRYAVEINGGLSPFNRPAANIRTSKGGPLLLCFWNKDREMWQVEPG